MAIHKLPDPGGPGRKAGGRGKRRGKIVIHLNVNLYKKQFGIPLIVCQ